MTRSVLLVVAAAAALLLPPALDGNVGIDAKKRGRAGHHTSAAAGGAATADQSAVSVSVACNQERKKDGDRRNKQGSGAAGQASQAAVRCRT